MNLDELRAEIRDMTPRTNLYKALKSELSMQGYWRNKPRGKPDARHFKPKEYND